VKGGSNAAINGAGIAFPVAFYLLNAFVVKWCIFMMLWFIGYIILSILVVEGRWVSWIQYLPYFSSTDRSISSWIACMSSRAQACKSLSLSNRWRYALCMACSLHTKHAHAYETCGSHSSIFRVKSSSLTSIHWNVSMSMVMTLQMMALTSPIISWPKKLWFFTFVNQSIWFCTCHLPWLHIFIALVWICTRERVNLAKEFAALLSGHL